MILLPPDVAKEAIMRFHQRTMSDTHGRDMSWLHCYKTFMKSRESGIYDDERVDYLALHLAFYLASWGMYRGSAFLFQKDYKVHIPIVQIILESQYNSLASINIDELIKEENLQLVESISDRIYQAYAAEKPSCEGRINSATDTLITKILLGTLGCVPAYDTYFLNAIKKYGISERKYGKNSLSEIAYYYLSNRKIFEKFRSELRLEDVIYPPMKMVDMCMWQLGYEDDMGK